MATYSWDLPLVKDKGYQGESVRLIQKLLIRINLLPAANAIYDDATIAAVREFQKNHTDLDGKPLVVDGQVGKFTWHALVDVITKGS
jgi:peptidoglycan hydrolase-like protein with peptidoglycan-binding domain